ncbi:MAG: calcium-binding protein [Actinomycetota bacterium]
MNYNIFDESYYLSKYPFVKDAINAGLVKSGLEHFQKYGQKLGLTEVSRYFDENYYLSNSPSVAAAVKSGVFASGLDHFIQSGYEAGWSRVSPNYDESFYLSNNPALIPVVQSGNFKSGLQHFIQYGAKEGRFGTSFFEPDYLKQNPGVANAVNAGVFSTGREHYVKYGQFESNRSATFVGSSSSDEVTGFGVGQVEIIGTDVGKDPLTGARKYESFGTNEFDLLIGSPGEDTFVLGVPASAGNFVPAPLYIGNGEARIRNFDIDNDYIQLQGSSLDNYRLTPSGSNLLIQTRFGDTLGIVEGGANLNLTVQASNPNGTFLIG